MKLYADVDDRYETMLAYEASFFPFWHMKEAHKIVFSKGLWISKEEVLRRCNEELTYIELLPQEREFSELPFLIHWAYGNIPTKQEWERRHWASVIHLEYRISPLIGEGKGRIALLTPHTQAYYSSKEKS